MNLPTRNFEATTAVRKEVPLLIGIMSPSGGGKTYSALRLATGIQQVYGGDIYGVDTENNRMLHYADQFKFKHVPFHAPFGSLDYLAALQWCNKQGARIIIVDSMTHEHIGAGGYLETAEATVTRVVSNMDGGDTYRNREKVKMLGWAEAGPKRQKMIEGIKQLDGAFIFCFRAKEKTKPVRNKEGKTDIIDMGLMPIAGEEWVYEMSVNCMLEPRSDGVPTWRSDHVGERMMMKLPAQFKPIFAEQAPLSETIGRQLAEWARGGKASAVTASVPQEKAASPESPLAPQKAGGAAPNYPTGGTDSEKIAWHDNDLAHAAKHGMAELERAWKDVPKPLRTALKAALDRRYKPTAEAADAKG